MTKLSSSLAIFVLLLSGAAPAETLDPMAEESSVTVENQDSARLRIGIAGGASIGTANGRSSTDSVSSLGLGPSVIFRLGAQLDRHWALYAQLSSATIIAASQGSGYGIVEYTKVRWLSVGTGVGVDFLDNFTIFCSSTCARDTWAGVSVPLIIGFNFLDEAGWNAGGRHSPLRLHVSGALGFEPSTGFPGGHVGVGIGKEWM